MNKKLILAIAILCFGLTAKAQSDFRPGYIILASGDTLHGEVDYRDDRRMGTICGFKNGDEKHEYAPADLKAYRFKDGKFFVSRDITIGTENRKVFLEYLIDGKMDVFYYRDTKGDHYFIEKDDRKLTELPYELQLKNEDGRTFQYATVRHIGLLSVYTEDAPSLQAQVHKIKEPKKKNLIKLAEDYHYEVCKDQSCITYEKKQPAVSIDLEIIGGYTSYRSTETSNSNTSIFGVLMHVGMPNTSEKLFFRTGITSTDYKYADSNIEKVLKLPLHLEYMFWKGKIVPRFSYGINFYRGTNFGIFENTVSATGGANFKFSKKMSLALVGELEFDTNTVFIPKYFMSLGVSTGLYIKL